MRSLLVYFSVTDTPVPIYVIQDDLGDEHEESNYVNYYQLHKRPLGPCLSFFIT